MNSVRLFQLPKVFLPGTSGGAVLTILLACVLGVSPIARADSMSSDLDSVSFDLTELATCFSSTPGGPPCTLAIAPPGHPFGNVMIQDDIVNRFAGQVDLPQGTEGVRFTITNFLPFAMGGVAFNSPTFVTVSNDVIYDGQAFPVQETNHVPLPGFGGEFFSNPSSNLNTCLLFLQGPFGCFANARTGLGVQHQLIFDVFHAYDPGVLELQDVLGLSMVIPPDATRPPFEQTIALATIQIGSPGFGPLFYFAGSPRPIPEPSSLLLLLGLLGVIGVLIVRERRTGDRWNLRRGYS